MTIQGLKHKWNKLRQALFLNLATYFSWLTNAHGGLLMSCSILPSLMINPWYLCHFFLWFIISVTKLEGLEASIIITEQKGMKWPKGKGLEEPSKTLSFPLQFLFCFENLVFHGVVVLLPLFVPFPCLNWLLICFHCVLFSCVYTCLPHIAILFLYLVTLLSPFLCPCIWKLFCVFLYCHIYQAFIRTEYKWLNQMDTL